VLDIKQLLYLGFQDLHNTHYSKGPLPEHPDVKDSCGTVPCAFYWPGHQDRAGVISWLCCNISMRMRASGSARSYFV